MTMLYRLEMTSEQAREVNKAVELLMRLKLNQPEEIPRAVLSWGEGLTCDEWCERRDGAEPPLREAFRQLFPTVADVRKDDEWHRLYNLHQVIRKAIHDAEHPETTGVDSYPPINSGGEKRMPRMEWKPEKKAPEEPFWEDGWPIGGKGQGA